VVKEVSPPSDFTGREDSSDRRLSPGGASSGNVRASMDRGEKQRESSILSSKNYQWGGGVCYLWAWSLTEEGGGDDFDRHLEARSQENNKRRKREIENKGGLQSSEGFEPEQAK